MELKQGFSAFACAVVACLSGCAANVSSSPEEAAVGTTEEAIGASCANVSADATFTGQITGGTFVSPRTYDTCNHGYVVDVKNLSSAVSGSNNWYLQTAWADTVPTNSTDCANSQVYTVFFIKNSSGTWSVVQSTATYGIWGIGGCTTPTVALRNPTPGATYRMASGARQFDANGNFIRTQKVSFSHYYYEEPR